MGDYKGGGYDRGHLAPAANHVSDEKGMADTFLLSNVSPQSPSFNRGYWLKLEKHVRHLVEEHGKIKVVTGPLFLPEQSEENGKRYVSYEVIGKSSIAVPTHFFKAIWTPQTEEAYILPNIKISAETPLESFRATIEEVERVSGVVFSQMDTFGTEKSDIFDIISKEKNEESDRAQNLVNSFIKDTANSNYTEAKEKFEELKKSLQEYRYCQKILKETSADFMAKYRDELIKEEGIFLFGSYPI